MANTCTTYYAVEGTGEVLTTIAKAMEDVAHVKRDSIPDSLTSDSNWIGHLLSRAGFGYMDYECKGHFFDVVVEEDSNSETGWVLLLS